MKKLLLGLLLLAYLPLSSQTYTYSHGTIYTLNSKTIDTATEINRARDFLDSSTFHDDVSIIVDTAKKKISLKTQIKTTSFKIVSREFDGNVYTITCVKFDDEEKRIIVGVFYIYPETGIGGFYYDDKTFIFLIQ